MTDDAPEQSCKACGTPIAKGLRYCVDCYLPVEGEGQAEVHREAAQQVTTTRRIDPTVIVSPESRSPKRRLTVIAMCVAAVALAATVLMVLELRSGDSPYRSHAVEREAMAKRELDLLSDALERFDTDIGRYPTNEEGLSILHRRPVGILEAWSGPYIEGIIEVDPWGNDYVYHARDGGRGFELFSHGPEGDQGGQVYLLVTSKN